MRPIPNTQNMGAPHEDLGPYPRHRHRLSIPPGSGKSPPEPRDLTVLVPQGLSDPCSRESSRASQSGTARDRCFEGVSDWHAARLDKLNLTHCL